MAITNDTLNSTEGREAALLEELETLSGVRWFKDSQVVLTMSNVLIALPGLLGNILTFLTICSSKIIPYSDGLSTVTYDVVASLAVSDALNCFGYAVVGLGAIYSPRGTTWWLSDWYGDMLNSAWFCTQFHLNLIAINRFVSVLYPTRCNDIFSKRKVAFYLALIWVLITIIFIPHAVQKICFIYVEAAETFFYDYTCPWTNTFTQLEQYFISPVSMVLILCCYVAIIVRIRQQKNRVAAPAVGENQQNAGARASHMDRSLTIQFGIVFAVYTVGEGIFLTINYLVGAGVAVPHFWDILITILLTLHFSINPAIYYLRNPHIRAQTLYMFRRVLCLSTRTAAQQNAVGGLSVDIRTDHTTHGAPRAAAASEFARAVAPPNV